MSVLGTPSTINVIENVALVSTSKDAEKISCKIANNAQSAIYYGEEIIIEKEHNNSWYRILPTKELVFLSILNVLLPDQEAKFTLDLNYWQPISSGRYRILKKISIKEEFTDFYYLSFEFSIS